MSFASKYFCLIRNSVTTCTVAHYPSKALPNPNRKQRKETEKGKLGELITRKIRVKIEKFKI